METVSKNYFKIFKASDNDELEKSLEKNVHQLQELIFFNTEQIPRDFI